MSESRETPYARAIPKPTAGPLIAAFGVAMLFAGVVTNVAASVVGAAALVFGAVRWFRDVMPEESVEPIEPTGGQTEVVPPPLPPRSAPSRRLVLPVEIHPYRAGVFGGLAGGVAMAAVAVAWGLVEHGSVWLPINLLAGAVNPTMVSLDEAQLAAFNAGWIAIATLIHVVLSIGTGLLFTVALPMMPRRPMLFGIVVAPVILSSLSWGTMGIVNPDARGVHLLALVRRKPGRLRRGLRILRQPLREGLDDARSGSRRTDRRRAKRRRRLVRRIFRTMRLATAVACVAALAACGRGPLPPGSVEKPAPRRRASTPPKASRRSGRTAAPVATAPTARSAQRVRSTIRSGARTMPDAQVLEAVAVGLGRLMPGFSSRAKGGPYIAYAHLGDADIELVVKGLRAKWETPGEPAAAGSAVRLGDAARGEAVFATSCVSCHADGSRDSVTSPLFLANITDQGLWSAVVFGRPDLGKPASDLAPAEIADVVAYLASKRPSWASESAMNPPLPAASSSEGGSDS